MGCEVGSTRSFSDSTGFVVMDAEGLYRVKVGQQSVLWIPDTAHDLQVRLMVCAHMKEGGHRGSVATLQRLKEYHCWSHVDMHLTEFVKQCLHCMDSKAGEKVPRPFRETVSWQSPGRSAAL